MMIIMSYYSSGDLIHYLSNNFYNFSWEKKLINLFFIIHGLFNIHRAKIIHRDLHSGNIFIDAFFAYIGDLGISRSATESNNDNEKYGIIPYMAPEIFQGQKYTKASDIYSFGMIMWEFMTGYIELMKECWHSDPTKRPTALDIFWKILKMSENERNINRTKIIESSDIGPVAINNPDAIYKSRALSCMIQSAISLRSLRSQSIDPFYYYQKNTDKRKFEDDDSVEDSNDNDYFTKEIKEIELDINMSSNQPRDKGYVTKEIDLDINDL
ncbi:kinase-like domain-containing protein [Rhizophagus diaphanus]|nr:kinase-like domain-containing protein [Rhizophagus diaphanus] [Rhizophagus sp. MUCL 43196]